MYVYHQNKDVCEDSFVSIIFMRFSFPRNFHVHFFFSIDLYNAFTNSEFTGTKALNRIHSSNSRSGVDGSITFVTVFTIYNSSLNDVDDKSLNTIVGNASYNKFGRSMALLNVFINFIQVNAK